jgi:hypothetical protein
LKVFELSEGFFQIPWKFDYSFTEMRRKSLYPLNWDEDYETAGKIRKELCSFTKEQWESFDNRFEKLIQKEGDPLYWRCKTKPLWGCPRSNVSNIKEVFEKVTQISKD